MTYTTSTKKQAGLLPAEMRRLIHLEDEIPRLKKIVVDLRLDREMLQGVIRRKLWSLVARANAFAGCAVSIRRAFREIGFNR